VNNSGRYRSPDHSTRPKRLVMGILAAGVRFVGRGRWRLVVHFPQETGRPVRRVAQAPSRIRALPVPLAIIAPTGVDRFKV
jgi:hypothetical protein